MSCDEALQYLLQNDTETFAKGKYTTSIFE